ncbi:MAG: cob(I)yrinic acid a,c-diamide adenosyltransferase [Patescibacteria group bacterium]|nr:cob(I)yrinic acid a,c-diamide adenosyltransferase [Patescibacteria group bacterium]
MDVNHGQIHCYTGDGKGKTTAALGLIVRAIGAGLKVAWVAFDKGGDDHYSERKILRERFPEVDLFITGLDRIDQATGKFRFGVTDEDRLEGKRGLEIVQKLFNDKTHDLIVLDEINSSAKLRIINENEVLDLLRQRPENIELVLTGRDAPESFVEQADLVSKITMVKHYFYSGIKARRGLDY